MDEPADGYFPGSSCQEDGEAILADGNAKHLEILSDGCSVVSEADVLSSEAEADVTSDKVPNENFSLPLA